MARLNLIFAAAVVAALAAGCATSGTQGTAGNPSAASSQSADRAAGLKATTTDPYAIRDMVRPPGIGNSMNKTGR